MFGKTPWTDLGLNLTKVYLKLLDLGVFRDSSGELSAKSDQGVSTPP